MQEIYKQRFKELIKAIEEIIESEDKGIIGDLVRDVISQ